MTATHGYAGLTNPPTPNIDYAFAYLPSVGGLVMHGGWCEPDWQPRSNTWLLTDYGWEQILAGPRMMHHSAALDTQRGVLVVCGRTNYPNNNVNPTFEFSGSAWLQKPTLVAGNDGDVKLAYDPLRRKTVAYVGGATPTETWEYDGTNWTFASTATQPSATAEGAVIGFDPVSNVVLLVVTTNELFSANVYTSETWTYDGDDWTRRASGQPLNAWTGGMACDTAHSNLVLLTTAGQTWMWTGSMWRRLTPSHAPVPDRGFFTFAFDPLRAVSSFFSGEYTTGAWVQVHPLDTWDWNGHTWSRFTPVPEPALMVAVVAVLAWRRRAA
jgi:hypothetical protein